MTQLCAVALARRRPTSLVPPPYQPCAPLPTPRVATALSALRSFVDAPCGHHHVHITMHDGEV
jgi:hypothetical protein